MNMHKQIKKCTMAEMTNANIITYDRVYKQRLYKLLTFLYVIFKKVNAVAPEAFAHALVYFYIL